ncbi:hypothetical protein LJC56_08580, partial [Christensenellaceae bacterium OttesenSCG-928-K19]|nr:hypothetical protein [Christensenellaceae bacterium OttesenSCG-928-K19]
STQEQRLPSNAGSIIVPLSSADALVVWQNGIELPADDYSFANGTLTVQTSPLGGDLSVVAYTSALRLARNAGGQVAHTRSDDQIYYGYYTHYFTANGNTAFCLQPAVPSAPTGTYPVSRYLQPGVDDMLIKCAYYLYGGPGYDSVKHNLFDDPDSLLAYAYSHLVAAYAYSGNSSEAFYKVSPSVVDHMMAVYASVGAGGGAAADDGAGWDVAGAEDAAGAVLSASLLCASAGDGAQLGAIPLSLDGWEPSLFAESDTAGDESVTPDGSVVVEPVPCSSFASGMGVHAVDAVIKSATHIATTALFFFI